MPGRKSNQHDLNEEANGEGDRISLFGSTQMPFWQRSGTGGIVEILRPVRTSEDRERLHREPRQERFDFGKDTEIKERRSAVRSAVHI